MSYLPCQAKIPKGLGNAFDLTSKTLGSNFWVLLPFTYGTMACHFSVSLSFLSYSGGQ